MATGRTVTRWTRFAVDDSAGTAREIPVDSISPVGFTSDEVEVTAYQDAVKTYLAGHPDAPIEVSGPFDNSAAAAVAASGLAPTLSGSHTVLSGIYGLGTPLALWIGFGIRGYWTTGDPAFGVATAGAAQGYLCTKYTVEGEKYTARFVPFPGTVPAWGTALIA
jgi:hypothetical protein